MAAKGKKRARAGDVVMLRAPGGVGYLQYIARHPVYGDAVLVALGLRETELPIVDEIFAGGYVTFYPLTAAVAQGLVEVVGHLPPPDLPKRFRRAGAIIGREVKTWIIESEGAELLVKPKLSEEDLRLPIAGIWNHEFLIQRFTEGWHPTQEGRSP